MDEVVSTEEAVAPAPTPDVTATPEAEVSTPEEKPRLFTQEELDAAIGKRLAREQRKWEREQKTKTVSAPVAPVEIRKPEAFATPDEADAYAEAVAAQKAEQLLAEREAARQRQELLDAYHEREEEARNKYDDFEQVVYNPNLKVTTVMAETIQASDIGPDLAYYLGANPKEADRIARLSPYLQAKEIGKIEVKLADNPPTKKTSTAPAPITPVTPRGSTAPTYDTTDPRSVKSMSTSEWIEADRARQRKKWETQQNR